MMLMLFILCAFLYCQLSVLHNTPKHIKMTLAVPSFVSHVSGNKRRHFLTRHWDNFQQHDHEYEFP